MAVAAADSRPRDPLPELVVRLEATALLVPMRCACHKLLCVGQILGVLQLFCGRCRRTVWVVPLYVSQES
mgnify:CR=1 FL=1